MPLYDYECSKCGSVFEVRQKFEDALLTEHEGCGGPIRRLISVPALQFKGTGFYITDYGKAGSSVPPKTESSKSESSKSESSKGESSKSESKSSDSSSSSSTSSDSKPASTTTKSE